MLYLDAKIMQHTSTLHKIALEFNPPPHTDVVYLLQLGQLS